MNDQHRNTNMNDKDHLVGQLTSIRLAFVWGILVLISIWNIIPSDGVEFIQFKVLQFVGNWIYIHIYEGIHLLEQRMKIFQNSNNSCFLWNCVNDKKITQCKFYLYQQFPLAALGVDIVAHIGLKSLKDLALAGFPPASPDGIFAPIQLPTPRFALNTETV